MKTLSLLLPRPPECSPSCWRALAATIAEAALKGHTLKVSNTGFSARSVIMLTKDSEPVIVWHVALHQDTSEEETKKLFSFAQEDYDLIKLSCTNSDAAIAQELKRILAALLK